MMPMPLYYFGERFGEAEIGRKDQDFLARVRSLLSGTCHQQERGKRSGTRL